MSGRYGLTRKVIALAWAVYLSATACAQPGSGPAEQHDRTVRIGVLSLFRPKELVLRRAAGSILQIELGESRVRVGETGAILLPAAGDGVRVEGSQDFAAMEGGVLRAYAASGRFWLEVPGKLRRQYSGTLEIQKHGQILEAIVTMPLEVAVASVVQAESPPGAGIEALKAQAVAARSFLVARQTAHTDFDFCDTTHCQFLRSPPAAGSPAAEAARATAGLVLSWKEEGDAREHTLAAMYARSCGGRSRTLGEIGVKSAGYPYYTVHCTYCSRHPEVWRRQPAGAGPGSATLPQTEGERLAFNRIHGWGAIPSIAGGDATTGAANDRDGLLTGRGIGHGIGLCQLGAVDMARRGAGFAEILAHYYPNTKLTTISAR